MSEADDFRAFAKECLEFARRAKTADQHQLFLQMAQDWAWAAMELESGASVHGPPFRLPPVPVRQRRVR